MEENNVDTSQSHKENYKDPLEATIGSFGKWQLKISLLMSLLKFPISWFTLSIVFLAPPTQFWCAPPPRYSKMSPERWLSIYLLADINSVRQDGLNKGNCEMFDLETNKIIPCKFGYSYNQSMFTSTIISEWDLICGNGRLIDLSQITLMLGVLLGNIFYGILADKYGRKKIIITCIILQSIFGVTASFVPYYWLFVICRFLVAVNNGGTMATSFIMCMEVVGGKWRTIVPILYQIPFGFGNTIMAGLAYLIRDWRYLHFSLSFLSSFYILYYWCIPESPRWLLATGRKTEAITLLEQAADENQIDQKKFQMGLTELSNFNLVHKQKPSLRGLFCTKELKKISCLLYLNWTLCGITFYAFSQYLGQIGTNIFLTVSTSGVVALPGTIACIVFVGKCGRRWTIACAHLLTAGCFFAIAFVPKGCFQNDWPRVFLSGLGIVGMSISMPALHLFTGELYPTVSRSAGVGVSIMFSRLGSMLAPLIITLEGKGTALPLIILGVVALIEVVLILPLPETKDLMLPETIEDLELCKMERIQKYEPVSVKIDHESD